MPRGVGAKQALPVEVHMTDAGAAAVTGQTSTPAEAAQTRQLDTEVHTMQAPPGTGAWKQVRVRVGRSLGWLLARARRAARRPRHIDYTSEESMMPVQLRNSVVLDTLAARTWLAETEMVQRAAIGCT